MAVLSCCRAGWRLSCYGRQVFARVGLSLIQTNSSSNFFYFGSVLVQTKPRRCPRQSFALTADISSAFPAILWAPHCVRAVGCLQRFVPSLVQILACSWYLQETSQNTPQRLAYLLLNLYDKSVFINLNVFARASYNARTFAESMYI